MMNKITIKSIEEEDFFIKLIEGLEAIITERNFIRNIEMIKMKYDIGKEIADNLGDAQRFGYGGSYIPSIAKKLNCHPSNLYHCLEVVKKFSEWEKFEEKLPKNATWSWVLENILSAPKEKIKKEKKYSLKKIRQMLISCFPLERLKSFDGNLFKVIDSPLSAQEILKR